MMSPLIPENISGKSVDIDEHIIEASTADAISAYKKSETGLLHPQTWHLISGKFSAEFILYGADAARKVKPADLGDFIAIDVPGPGSVAGGGFDWVKIELLQKNVETGFDESVVMQLRACSNPLHSESGTAHFFTSQATSTFIITRLGLRVAASYHGRNETPNTTDVSILDKLRNTVVAGGAAAGFSNLQWEALIKGLLRVGMEK